MENNTVSIIIIAVLYHTIRLFFSHRDSIFVAERDPDEKYGRKR